MNNEVIAQDLLDILVCPVCHGDLTLLEYQADQHGLKCTACKLIYPIREGIPVMLSEEAIKAE